MSDPNPEGRRASVDVQFVGPHSRCWNQYPPLVFRTQNVNLGVAPTSLDWFTRDLQYLTWFKADRYGIFTPDTSFSEQDKIRSVDTLEICTVDLTRFFTNVWYSKYTTVKINNRKNAFKQSSGLENLRMHSHLSIQTVPKPRKRPSMFHASNPQLWGWKQIPFAQILQYGFTMVCISYQNNQYCNSLMTSYRLMRHLLCTSFVNSGTRTLHCQSINIVLYI